jgi:hypothetical protein
VTESDLSSLQLVNLPCSADEVLYYCNGPQVFWLPHPELLLLAVALPDEAGSWPFLVVEMAADAAKALETNRLTLLAAVQGGARHYLLADFNAEILALQPLPAVPPAWLPGDVTLAPPVTYAAALDD